MHKSEEETKPKKPAKGKGPSAKGKDGLTMKQRKLVKGIASGKTQKQAAIDAGYSPKHAESAASHEINKTQVKATLLELMEKHGLDDESLLKVHKEMVTATRDDSPDWPTRCKGVEMAYKLKGAFVEKKEVTFPAGIKLNVNFVKPE